ncbi:MAG TPA: BamA/TamA family outer membrane protein, partial [Gemmatimonadaceae bacterium]|nr:BamA/TamA family outer membrane protein [Gemmatimonadaceae bacterium]
ACIRDQLFVVPGDVYSQDRMMRSWENIGNLKFFETPLPEPDIVPSANKENVDITFKVKEKRTGNLNFGASVGQGTGLGGFIGFDQPNLFGLCKEGSIQWQYGQYINNFNVQYTDPHFEGSRVSSSISAHHTQSRFTIGDLGESITTGADLTLGFPLAHSRQTRLYTTYSAEQVKYGNSGLVDSIQCNGCYRSSIGLTLENNTQIGTPFPYTGSRQSITAQFNGGPLGGSAEFTRYLGEMDTYATLAKLPSSGFGSQPMLIVFGLQMRAGAVFGDDGPFFVSQSFSLGGTQYGEPLRGYPEFSITPAGYVPSASEYQAERSSFGDAFYTSTMSLNLRVTEQLNLDLFYDAGNIWSRPEDFDPTRLFRGAGFGAGIVTPLGPLGVDLGYGFDRVDAFGRPAPAWQVHFKFGQLF